MFAPHDSTKVDKFRQYQRARRWIERNAGRNLPEISLQRQRVADELLGEYPEFAALYERLEHSQ